MYIASCNILALNNDHLEDFPSRFLFCHENNQLQEHRYGQGPGLPQFKFNNLFSVIFPYRFYFSKVFCRLKTCEVWR